MFDKKFIVCYHYIRKVGSRNPTRGGAFMPAPKETSVNLQFPPVGLFSGDRPNPLVVVFSGHLPPSFQSALEEGVFILLKMAIWYKI